MSKNVTMAFEGNDTFTGDHGYWRQGFLESAPAFAYPCVIVLGITAAMGTFGNFITILVICRDKMLHTPDSVFIANLAFSDMFVTSVAIPFSIIGKTEGEDFFNQLPGLCRTIASLCTVSCVTSLMSIGLMSVNRYVYICVHDKYEHFFSKMNCVCLCVSLYFVGGLFVLLNLANIGDHGFDRKSLDCILDRTATYPYTVIYSVTLVWIPSVFIAAFYLKTYLYVRQHCRRVANQLHPSTSTSNSFNLAKTLFTVYAVFITCWAPYALLIVIDRDDRLPKELHLFITMFAHLHPSFNWIIYYKTNTKFAKAYRHLFLCWSRNLNSVVPQPGSGSVR